MGRGLVDGMVGPEQWERKETLEGPVQMVYPAVQVPKALVVLTAVPASLAQMAVPVVEVMPELRAGRDLQVVMDPPASRADLVPTAPRERLVSPGDQVPRDVTGRTAGRGSKVRLERPA